MAHPIKDIKRNYNAYPKRLTLMIICLHLGLAGFAQQEKDSLLFAHKNFSLYKNKAFRGDVTIYNAETDKLRYIERESDSGDDCTVFYESHYKPMSLVGTMYSYEYGESDQSACGPMGNSLGFTTLNIETGDAVSIVALIAEKNIVAALKNDSWILERTHDLSIDLTPINTFQEMLDLLHTNFGVRFNASSFYILGFKDGIAQIRFVGNEYMGYDHYQHVQLGLEVAVRECALKLFANTHNFYYEKFNTD